MAVGVFLLGKSLPYKKEDQSLIPLQKKNEVLSVAICTHIPMLEQWKPVDPWSLLASQLSLLDKL